MNKPIKEELNKVLDYLKLQENVLERNKFIEELLPNDVILCSHCGSLVYSYYLRDQKSNVPGVQCDSCALEWCGTCRTKLNLSTIKSKDTCEIFVAECPNKCYQYFKNQ